MGKISQLRQLFARGKQAQMVPPQPDDMSVEQFDDMSVEQPDDMSVEHPDDMSVEQPDDMSVEPTDPLSDPWMEPDTADDGGLWEDFEDLDLDFGEPSLEPDVSADHDVPVDEPLVAPVQDVHAESGTHRREQGQPIAISEAAKDPRFEREIAEAVDYVPNTILCVPLILNDSVIGVLELMDKAGGQLFTPADMEILGKFARLAAITIDESRLTNDISRLFRALLNDAAQGNSLTDAANRFADSSVDLPENADAMRLAGLVQEISSRSDVGRQLAIDILTNLSSYLKSASTLPR